MPLKGVPFIFSILLIGLLTPVCGAEKPPAPAVIRLGYFPNLTHAQALVARNLSRQGRGWFEERLGTGVQIQWFAYNAGPTAMEALLAGTLDVTYVGPSPALNAYIRSRGAEVRVLAGAAEGGAALVVQGDSTVRVAADFRDRILATPQFGNTQDVACRFWLRENGLRVTMTGGDVRVVPMANPDQLALFIQRKLDGVWTVEPWVSRLELQANGKVFLEETNALTTLLAARVGFVGRRDLARRFVAAHRELTAWVNEHPAEARRLVVEELTEETRRPFPSDIVERAWGRLHFTGDVSLASLERLVTNAQAVGFLPKAVPLDRLIATP
jgi:NitT/TauT family transport system substrate-binding protein